MLQFLTGKEVKQQKTREGLEEMREEVSISCCLVFAVTHTCRIHYCYWNLVEPESTVRLISCVTYSHMQFLAFFTPLVGV